MYGYIYKTTNIVNNKIYIGKHKSSTFDSNYLGSGKLINSAIIKYGRGSFKVEILCVCDSLSELNIKEKFYIYHFHSKYKYGTGYNILSGGDGGPTNIGTHMVHKDNITKFVSDSELETYLSDGYCLGAAVATKQQIRANCPHRIGESNPFYGKTHTTDTKHLIGEKSKQKNMYGDNNPAKRVEVRKKISDKAKSPTNYFKIHKFYYVNNGDIEYRLVEGSPIPEGFVKGRIKHCWIHDNNIEKLVIEKDYIKYINRGFQLGRLPDQHRQRGSLSDRSWTVR